jgi:predicted Zn-dependent peptidase
VEGSLAPATAASLSAFHRSRIGRNWIVVSAAGSVDEDELLAEVERRFGDMVLFPARGTFASHHARRP